MIQGFWNIIGASCLTEYAKIGELQRGSDIAGAFKNRMLLSREFIDYLSRQLVTRMTPQIIETSSNESAAEMISQLIEEELQVEDRLNDEVREILTQHQDEMRRTGVSYQEMYKKVKGQLARDRKLVLR